MTPWRHSFASSAKSHVILAICEARSFFARTLSRDAIADVSNGKNDAVHRSGTTTSSLVHCTNFLSYPGSNVVSLCHPSCHIPVHCGDTTLR